MKTPTLIGLGIGGTTALAGTGVAINHFYGGDSIKVHIQKKNKTSNKIFLTSEHTDLATIKQKYVASNDNIKRPKPKKDGKVVGENDLAKWCEEVIKEKFISEDNDIYKSVLSWCYINTNSFAEELKKNDNKKISEQSASEQVWKDAWTDYSREKNNPQLRIDDSERNSNLNGEAQEAGATALHAWCTTKNSIKLYEDNAEDIYVLFVKWCPTTKA